MLSDLTDLQDSPYRVPHRARRGTLCKRPLWVVGRLRQGMPSFYELPMPKGGPRAGAGNQQDFLWLKGRGKWGRPLRGFTRDLVGSQSQKEPGARNQATRFMSADITGETPWASPSWSLRTSSQSPLPVNARLEERRLPLREAQRVCFLSSLPCSPQSALLLFIFYCLPLQGPPSWL